MKKVKAEDSPNKVIKTPKKTPMKPQKTPKITQEKVEKTPKKLVNPKKNGFTPKPVQSPKEPAVSPKKGAQTPKKNQQTPKKPAQTPAKTEASPKNAAQTPKSPKQKFNKKQKNQNLNEENGSPEEKTVQGPKTPKQKFNKKQKTPQKPKEESSNEESSSPEEENGHKENKNKKAMKRKATDSGSPGGKKVKIDPSSFLRTIYVGNVPLNANETDIKKIFGQKGKIENVHFKGGPPLVDPKNLKAKKNFVPKGTKICFILFSTEEEAQAALSLNQHVLKNNPLRVNIHNKARKPTNPKHTIFVGSLPFKIEEEELKKIFEVCGPIKSVKIERNKKTSLSRGYGFVEFENADAVQVAFQMEDITIGDRTLRVSKVDTKEDVNLDEIKSVLVQNIPRLARKHQLFNAFKHCGTIECITYRVYKGKRAAVVSFKKPEEASLALKQNVKLGPMRHFLRPDKFKTDQNITIKNIPASIKHFDIKSALKKCGLVEIVFFYKNGSSRQATVTFHRRNGADKALALGEITIDGHKLKLHKYQIENIYDREDNKQQAKVKTVKQENGDDDESDSDEDVEDEQNENSEDDDDDDDDDEEGEDEESDDDDDDDDDDEDEEDSDE